jgi:succinate dehydrogenase / fumarate reductase, cytochrome b subunit
MSIRALTLIDTTIGKKALMAVSGIVLLGFVLAHMAGNLLVFAGPAALNGYADGLRTVPALLWVARAVLVGAVGAHIWAAISLTKLNRGARGTGYQVKRDLATTYAAKTMPIGGMVVLLFIIFHLAHLTFGVAIPGGISEAPLAGPGVKSGTDVYHNVVSSFQVAWIAGIYIIAQLALAMHLYHGAWSLMQTLGLSHKRFNPLRRKLAMGFAGLIAVGNIAIPTAILAGFITLQ